MGQELPEFHGALNHFRQARHIRQLVGEMLTLALSHTSSPPPMEVSGSCREGKPVGHVASGHQDCTAASTQRIQCMHVPSQALQAELEQLRSQAAEVRKARFGDFERSGGLPNMLPPSSRGSYHFLPDGASRRAEGSHFQRCFASQDSRS